MNIIYDDNGKRIDLDKLLKEHLARFDKFIIDCEIWNVKMPKNLNDN